MFNKITIIGVGLIGGSVALACKKHGLAQKITGSSRKQETLDEALKLGLIDEGYTDLRRAVTDADLVMICTPLGSYKKLAKDISKYLKNGAILTDVGSVKSQPSKDIYDGLGEEFHANFVPAHPIAGTEKSGPSAAFAQLYEGKKIILTPHHLTDKNAVEKVTEFWQAIGGEINIIKADRHDFIYATISHSIQLLSYAYGLSVADLENGVFNEIYDFSDENYKKFIRLNGSDPAMWRDIFIINKQYLLNSVDLFKQHISSIANQIKNQQGDIIANRLEASKTKRISFHDILKNGHYNKFKISDYSDASNAAKTWLDMLPRLISAILMETISENEYQYATGAGLHSLTKNIILENATNPDDLIENRQLLLDAINDFITKIDYICKAVEREDAETLKTLFLKSQGFYNQISCTQPK